MLNKDTVWYGLKSSFVHKFCINKEVKISEMCMYVQKKNKKKNRESQMTVNTNFHFGLKILGLNQNILCFPIPTQQFDLWA